MPLVSVIIPNFNHEKYLTERIESVLKQSLQDFEIILLDDCSSDKSKIVLESFRGHPKVSQILYNEQNSGSTFLQWEKGFTLAQGEFIWIAESDDVAMPNFLKTTADLLSNYEDLAYVVTNVNYINSDGLVIQAGFQDELFPEDKNHGVRIFEGNSFVKDFQFKRNYVANASSVLFRKNHLRKADPVFKTYKLTGDWMFWSDLAENSRIGVVYELLSNFRFHNTTVRNTLDPQRIVAEVDAFYNYILNKPMFDVAFKRAYYKQLINDQLFVIGLNKQAISTYFKDRIYFRNREFISAYQHFIRYKFPYLKYVYHPVRKLYFVFQSLVNKFKS